MDKWRWPILESVALVSSCFSGGSRNSIKISFKLPKQVWFKVRDKFFYMAKSRQGLNINSPSRRTSPRDPVKSHEEPRSGENAGTLAVLVCGPSKSTSRWTRVKYKLLNQHVFWYWNFKSKHPGKGGSYGFDKSSPP